MNRTIQLCALLLAVLLLPLTACTSGGDSPAADTSVTDAAGTEQPTDAPTAAPTDAITEVPTEVPTDVPTEPETEPATEAAPLFTPAEPRELGHAAFEASAVYSEKHTKRSGFIQLKDVGATVSYDSEFYGHDAAINRDLCFYAVQYEEIKVRNSTGLTRFVTASLDGGHNSQLLSCADGVLTVQSIEVGKRKTFEFGGVTYTSVFCDRSNSYTMGETVTCTLGTDAVLCGAGLFTGDRYTDLVLVAPDGTLLLARGRNDGFDLVSCGCFTGNPERLFAGDVDGNGVCDLVYVDGLTFTPLLFDGKTFVPGTAVTSPLVTGYDLVTVGDMNQDKRTDIVLLTREDKTVLTLFGRGDGFFGPHEDEMTNGNLFGSGKLHSGSGDFIAVGDATGEGVGDLYIVSDGALRIALDSCDPPYDYSIFGMQLEDGTYRLYSGGRWTDRSDAVANSTFGYGDGDHVMVYESADGKNWLRRIDGPAFYLGCEQGYEDWWTSNTLEPEVVYVDGVYHMFLQCSHVTESGFYGDYINYASSTDGYTFTRKTDRAVILPDRTHAFDEFTAVYGYEIGFNHEEVIYVPDDPDGKCFWMYTGHFINNNFSGYVRIRSADPTAFYWDERENTTGFCQIGNQICYLNNYDGKGTKLFLRITFDTLTDEAGTRTVPVLQYSADGLNFKMSDIRLAGVDVTDPVTESNHNTYFLGFCTKNGTGEVKPDEDGKVRLLYLATTANDAAGMPIFWAEGGVGELVLKVTAR